jgi:antitoxin YefM
MAIQTTYTRARQNLAKLLSEVSENKEIVYVSRRKGERVAMISEDELAGLLETAHLLRSPKNAERLLTALNRALKNKTRPMTLDQLREKVGLGRENP